MKRNSLLVVLLITFSLSGCAFMMKEYDDAQERRLNELIRNNRQLQMTVRNLQSKIPTMNNQIQHLGKENEKLKRKIVELQAIISSNEGSDARPAVVERPAAEETAVTPKAEAVEKAQEPVQPAQKAPKAPEPPKPEPQAKSELTPAGARLLELARAKAAGKTVKSTEMTAVEAEMEAEANKQAEEAIAEQKEAGEAETVAKAEPQPSVQEAAAKAEPEPAAQEAVKAAPSSVKLKVLSGTGDLISGQKMAKTLYDMGYEAEKVDVAPKPFDQNVVYYAKGYEKTAEEIRSSLGGETITKPLSWKSEFDIIVVTGKR